MNAEPRTAADTVEGVHCVGHDRKAHNELRKAGLKPLASANLLYELSLQLNYVCNIITAEPAARNACKANLPSAVTFPVPNPSKAQ